MRKTIPVMILALLTLSLVVFGAVVTDIRLNSPSNGQSITIGPNDKVRYEFDSDDDQYDTCRLYTNETGTLTHTSFDTTNNGHLDKYPSYGVVGYIDVPYNSDVSLEWSIGCINSSLGATYDTITDYRNLTIDLNEAPTWKLSFISSVSSTIALDEDNASKTIAQMEADDPESAALTYRVEGNPSEVVCTTDANNNILAQPASNFYGAASCTAFASDGLNEINKTINFNVAPKNDAPSYTGSTSINVVESGTKQFNLTAAISDVDDVDHTFTIVEEDSNKVDCSISGDYLNAEAKSGASGSSVCKVQITDFGGGAGLGEKVSVNATITYNIVSASKSVSSESSGLILTRNPTNLAEHKSGNVVVTINNTGNVALSNMHFSVLNLVNGKIVDSRGNLTVKTLSASAASLDVDQELTITIPVEVLDPELSNETIPYSGTLNVSADGYETTAPFTVTLRNPTTSLEMSPSVIDFGSVDRNTTTSVKSFKLNNTGDVAVTNLKINYTGSRLWFSFSDNANWARTLDVGTVGAGSASNTIYIKGDVPNSQSGSVLDTFKVTSNELSDLAYEAHVTTRSFLLVDDIKSEITYIGGSSESDDVSDGQAISDDAEPGSDVTIKVKLKNNYETNVDDSISDMDNFNVELDVNGLDLDDDTIEESYDETKGADKTTDWIELNFQVPYDADEGTYDIDIVATADDNQGNEHEAKATIRLKVNRKTHYLRFDDLRFSIDEVDACLQPSTELIFDVVNLGEEDEDDIEVTIKNSELDLDLSETFALDSTLSGEDDGIRTIRKTITIDDDTSLKTYPVQVTLYRNGNEMGSDSVDLTVLACRGSSSGSSGSSGSTVEVHAGVDSSVDAGSSTVPVDFEKSKMSFGSEGLFLTLLILGNLAALGGIICLVIKFIL